MTIFLLLFFCCLLDFINFTLAFCDVQALEKAIQRCLGLNNDSDNSNLTFLKDWLWAFLVVNSKEFFQLLMNAWIVRELVIEKSMWSQRI